MMGSYHLWIYLFFIFCVTELQIANDCDCSSAVHCFSECHDSLIAQDPVTLVAKLSMFKQAGYCVVCFG